MTLLKAVISYGIPVEIECRQILIKLTLKIYSTPTYDDVLSFIFVLLPDISMKFHKRDQRILLFHATSTHKIRSKKLWRCNFCLFSLHIYLWKTQNKINNFITEMPCTLPCIRIYFLCSPDKWQSLDTIVSELVAFVLHSQHVLENENSLIFFRSNFFHATPSFVWYDK